MNIRLMEGKKTQRKIFDKKTEGKSQDENAMRDFILIKPTASASRALLILRASIYPSNQRSSRYICVCIHLKSRITSSVEPVKHVTWIIFAMKT